MNQSRCLAPFEKWYYWRNELEMYSNFRVAVEYKKELTARMIFEIVNEMVYKYPNLTMNVYKQRDNLFTQLDENDDSFEFRFMQSFKLSDVLEIINDESLRIKTIFDHLQNRRFKYGQKPLWKLILLNRHTLIYFSDHVLFDGTSGANFHKIFGNLLIKKGARELRDEFKDIDSIVFDISHTDKKKYQLAPNPSQLLDYSVPLNYLLYIVMIFFLPKFISNAIQFYTDQGSYSNKKSYNILKCPQRQIIQKDLCEVVNVNKELLTKLLGKCRENNVKFTSFLVILAQLSIKSITGPFNDTMTIVPVNSRFQLNQQNDHNYDFGLYLGDLHIELPAIEKLNTTSNSHDGFNWDLIKHVNESIHRDKHASQRDLGLVSWINPKTFLKQRKESMDNQLCATLVVSNLGNIKQVTDEYGNDIINNAWFDQPCQSATLGLFSLSVIGSPNGCNFILRSMERKWLAVFKNRIEQLLANLSD